MADFAHTAILASAGAGKTWQLSTRYLRLLALGASPARILASTFTRAAAGEIRDRILARLALAASDDKELKALAEAIDMTALSRDRVTEILAGLARELHTLQIRTLDSFFAAVVRCFSLELGLPRDAAIVDGERAMALRRDAIRTMLDEAEHEPLVGMLRQLIEGRSDRSVTATIDHAVSCLHELYREAPPEAWEAIDYWPVLDDALITRAIDDLERAGASIALSDSRHARALARDVEVLRRCRRDFGDDWAEFLGGGLAKCVAGGGDVLYHRKPVARELLPHYKTLIHHARGVLRNMLASRTRATRDLLSLYDAAYQRARLAHRAVTFADLTAAVTSEQFMRQPELLDDLYFRLDGRLDHLLFDEMQDTSIQQWRALRPMVEEIIATRPGQRTFFCVGDVKQSIYGWREACPELLDSLTATYPALTAETLARSRRSAQPVIDAVNRVFSNVRGNRALDDHETAAEAWDVAWTAHSTVHEKTAGYVELRSAARAADDDDQATLRLNQAADMVADLHHRASGITIGILTRTNKAAARMLFELGPSRRNIPATARGGGLLTDAPPVNAVLDALRLADHPGHSIAAFNIMHSPLGEHLDFHDSGDSSENHRRSVRLARRIRGDVQERGFASVIEEWARAIGPSVDPRQSRRLHELIDAADQFDRDRLSAGIRCDDFARTVQAMVAADPAPAPIEVMTIHKSKGLEFDAIILPDLEGEIASMRNVDVVVERESAGGPPARICRGTRREVWQQFDDLRPMFEAHCNRLARESLCVLYVAMTRAKRGLYMLVDPARVRQSGDLSDTVPKTLAGVLACALGNAAIDANETVFAHGDPAWMEERGLGRAREGEHRRDACATGQIEIPIRLAPSTRVRAAAIAAPSEQASVEHARSLADVLRVQPDEAFDRGRALHALLERIEWLDEGAPDREECLGVVCSALPRRTRAWCEAVVGSFLEAIGREQVRAVLSRNGMPGTVKVWRELRYARLVEGAVQQGAIDRLVAWHDDREGAHRCSRATIIDFKTDDVAAEDCAIRASTYEAQIAAYRAAAAEFLQIDRDQVTASLVFLQPGVVVAM